MKLSSEKKIVEQQMELQIVRGEKERTAAFTDRIMGRVIAENAMLQNQRNSLKAGEEINEETAKALEENEVQEVIIRSPLVCTLPYGLCAYVMDGIFRPRNELDSGVPVGVMAAQSIGEPGTQLTMRVTTYGGVVMSDVTQGLPRVEELFEMRTPKNWHQFLKLPVKLRLKQPKKVHIIHC